MNILIVIFSRNNKILQIDQALEGMGFRVSVVYTDDYWYHCSYIKKKMDQLGVGKGRACFEASWKKDFYDKVKSFHPEIIFCVNLPAHILSVSDIENLSHLSRVFCWFVDGIHDNPEYIPYFSFIEKIAVFELQDVEYLRKHNVENPCYVPIGYSKAYGMVGDAKSRNIDISFIGSPLRHRLKILERIAEEAGHNGWNMRIYGPFYESRYFWKKYVLWIKYPNIFRCLRNGYVTTEQAANIYVQSKIALNIHDTRHSSPNPRTFDILAAGTLEISDVRQNYVDGLLPVKAYVVYENLDDLIEKLHYYLKNELEREKIARYGKENNIYSMEYSLRMIFG